MVKGIIFDLHKFAINDGPGIRTTVFLKGCPLRCLWCHNPESQQLKPQISFNQQLCNNCFKCVDACTNNAHYVEDGKHIIDHSKCRHDFNCSSVCETGALKVQGREYTVDEIIAEVIKDKKYFNRSGGGLTISGGEPMHQFEFTKNLLIEAKNRNIHTCLDTSGYGLQNRFEEILPYVDLFLFDIKAADENDHIALTGVSNKIILENLAFLYKNKANITLRMPLIPGVNDSIQQLDQLKQILNQYYDLEFNIMPYHSVAAGKYKSIGVEYQLEGVKDASESDKNYWLNQLNAYSIKIA